MRGEGYSFDPVKHEYYIGSSRIPSVTQVLEPLQLLEGVPLDALEAGRLLGQNVHDACALAIRKQLEWKTLDPLLVPYVSAAQKCLRDLECQVLRVEYRMYDPNLRIAGTLDILGLIDRQTTIIDWKSATTMSRTTALQLAGYEHLHTCTFGGKHNRKMKRLGVQLKPDGSYKLYPYEDPRDHNWFLSALNIWHWKNS